MKTLQVGLYARVSSDQQAEAKTIESQLAEIRTQIQGDGLVLNQSLEFVDNGYSGATLIRPALERLRDQAAAGEIDRLYVHCPDRFARNFAYQVLLLEELTRAGVVVIFLNRPLGQTPEDQLLLQVQGVVAEYERAKLLERSRRGKRHAAQVGRVGILCHAPYGYRYVSKHEGGGEARYEIISDDAQVVQQVFTWIGEERCTINAVCRRLHQAGILTQTGKAHWDHKTIWDMLKNPAYKGQAAFGKTRWLPVAPHLRAPKGRPEQSRRGYSGNTGRKRNGLPFLFPRLSIQLCLMRCKNNWKRTDAAPGSSKKVRGICYKACSCVTKCGYVFCGRTNDARNAYYRCAGAMNIPRHGFERVCWNKELRMDQTDEVVWQAVCQLLENPQRLEQEYRQRLQKQPDAQAGEALTRLANKLRRRIDRLIDSYAEGLIEQEEFEPRVKRMRERIQHLEGQIQEQKEVAKAEEDIQLVLGCLENFATKVKDGLQQADFANRREIIRALVKRVEVDEQQIRIVFRVSPTPHTPSSQDDPQNWQHCGRRVLSRALHRNMGDLILGEPI